MNKAANLESVNCALCASRDASVKMQARDWLHQKPGVFQVVQCNQCGLVYLNPRPTQETILEYYPADYAYAPGSQSHPTSLRQRLLQTILARFYGYPIAQPHLPWMIQPLVDLYHRFYRTIALPIIPWRSGGRVLDVGCGKGDYLSNLRQLGWQTQGVEINPRAVRYAREELHLDIFQGDFLQSNLPDACFDAVCMWWYLEHVPAPGQVLEQARRVLKPDGTLWIGVPNWASIEARLFGGSWYHLDAPRHFYLFTPTTLQSMLHKAGFASVQISYLSWFDDPGQSVERWLRIKQIRQRALPRAVRLSMAPFSWLTARLSLGSLLIARARMGESA